jgi:hypothetical protein
LQEVIARSVPSPREKCQVGFDGASVLTNDGHRGNSPATWAIQLAEKLKFLSFRGALRAEESLFS